MTYQHSGKIATAELGRAGWSCQIGSTKLSDIGLKDRELKIFKVFLVNNLAS